jgi:hypothetical protein
MVPILIGTSRDGRGSQGGGIQLAATRRRIGELLVQLGYVTREDLDAALDAQQREIGQHLGEILIAQGKLSRLELGSALFAQWDQREPGSPEPVPELEPAERPVGEAAFLDVEDRPPATDLEASARTSAAGLERRIQDQLDQIHASLGELRAQVQALADRRSTGEHEAPGEKKPKEKKKKKMLHETADSA